MMEIRDRVGRLLHTDDLVVWALGTRTPNLQVGRIYAIEEKLVNSYYTAQPVLEFRIKLVELNWSEGIPRFTKTGFSYREANSWVNGKVNLLGYIEASRFLRVQPSQFFGIPGYTELLSWQP